MISDLDDSVLNNFRTKYQHLHPLVFQRSLERSSSLLELFEILEGVPSEPPYSWDESRRSWSKDEDLICSEALKLLRKRDK